MEPSVMIASNPAQEKGRQFAGPANAIEPFTAWSPVIESVRTWQRAFLSINGELSNFVSCRLNEDLALTRRLAACRRPDEMWQTYSEFLMRMTSDYQTELMNLSRLGMDMAADQMDRPAQSEDTRYTPQTSH